MSSLAVLAVAIPWTSITEPTKTVTVTAPGPTTTTASQCDTGDLQCCEATTSGDSATANTLLGLLGVVLSDVDVLVGINCDPITVIGSGSACNAEPVCCTDNSYGNLISIGCVPVVL